MLKTGMKDHFVKVVFSCQVYAGINDQELLKFGGDREVDEIG